MEKKNNSTAKRNDLPRERAALVLSKNHPDMFVDAVRALDVALGAIPESK